MQNVDNWHRTWILVGTIGGLLLVITLLIAFDYRGNSNFANFSSIGGLGVGLIGFCITIYTLFETQRIARDAQREIQEATAEAQQAIQKAAAEAQEAVKSAQQQTRQLLDRVRHGVREADFSTLNMWLHFRSTDLDFLASPAP